MQLPPEEFYNSEIFRSTTARYALEHKELPAAFFSLGNPDVQRHFIETLQNSRAALIHLMHTFLCHEMDQNSQLKQISYSPDMFNVFIMTSEESGAPFECNVAIITMPPPERTILCERIFLLYSDDLERQGYFTVERATVLQPGDAPYLLCGWNPYGSHFNCGVGFFNPTPQDAESDPNLLVASTSPHTAVNRLPNRIKAELNAVYRYFAGLERPQLSINPTRMNKLVEEWKKTHPGQELTDEIELARLMKRSVHEEDDEQE